LRLESFANGSTNAKDSNPPPSHSKHPDEVGHQWIQDLVEGDLPSQEALQSRDAAVADPAGDDQVEGGQVVPGHCLVCEPPPEAIPPLEPLLSIPSDSFAESVEKSIGQTRAGPAPGRDADPAETTLR
jgi:hypothetical protein